MLGAGDVIRIRAAPWWQAAAARIDERISTFPRGARVALLYGADADGFASAYFMSALLRADRFVVEERAVWNHEYDLLWLADYVAGSGAAAVVALDIPVMRDPALMRRLGATLPVTAYDHHVGGAAERETHPGVTYLNSRLIDEGGANHPASAFAAAFAVERIPDLGPAELYVLLAGLIGDRAEERHPELCRRLDDRFPELAPCAGRGSEVRRLTRGIDALFRASIGTTPTGALAALRHLLTTQPPARALEEFARTMHLDAFEAKLQGDVDRIVARFRGIPPVAVIAEVIEDLSSFSIGVAASRLARSGTAGVVVLGFHLGDKACFEMRTSQPHIDITSVLELQRQRFTPLNAGGHPNAAGAVVHTGDADTFMQTFVSALQQVVGVDHANARGAKERERRDSNPRPPA